MIPINPPGSMNQNPGAMKDNPGAESQNPSSNRSMDDEQVEVCSQPRLINPGEVRVCQPLIFQHAEPVLTPLEKLRRYDGKF